MKRWKRQRKFDSNSHLAAPQPSTVISELDSTCVVDALKPTNFDPQQGPHHKIKSCTHRLEPRRSPFRKRLLAFLPKEAEVLAQEFYRVSNLYQARKDRASPRASKKETKRALQNWL